MCGRGRVQPHYSGVLFLGQRLQSPGEFFERDLVRQWDSAIGDGNCRIALHNRHRRDGLADDATGGDHCATSDGYVGQDDHPGSDESILLDLYTLSLPEMCDDHYTHTQRGAIFDGDEVRPRSVQDHVVADPNTFSYVHAAPAMQADTQASGAGQNSCQVLTDTIPNTRPEIFFHFSVGLSNRRVGGETRNVANALAFNLWNGAGHNFVPPRKTRD